MACSTNPLVELLKKSTLTPGIYQLSDALRSAQLVAVCAGSIPVLLTGSADDNHSKAQAQSFCDSELFAQLLVKLNFSGVLSVRIISGDQLSQSCEAIVASQSGVSETREIGGQLLMINPTTFKELTLMLCVTTEFARMIDSKAPELDSGELVSRFIQGDQQALQLQP